MQHEERWKLNRTVRGGKRGLRLHLLLGKFFLVLPSNLSLLASRFFFLRTSSSALFFRRSDEDDCRFDEEVDDEGLVGSDLVLLLPSSFVLRSDLSKRFISIIIVHSSWRN